MAKSFRKYMGRRAWCAPTSMILTALSAILAALCYYFVWLVLNDILSGNGDWASGPMRTHLILVFVFAILHLVVYIVALLVSHWMAFHVETNMRYEAVKSLTNKPLGFFQQTTSGKLRKVIDDEVSITHTYLAHQLPDLGASFVTPIIVFILILIFDWRLGLLTLIPFMFAMGLMLYMMGGKGRVFMQLYMDAQEDMNSEAIEYVRGIPVVKVFQQTVHTFKRFHKSIIRYRDMVKPYTRAWRVEMTLYTTVIEGTLFFLVPGAVYLLTRGDAVGPTVSNLILYAIVVPVLTTSVMRSMYLFQASTESNEARKRLEAVIEGERLPEPAETKVPANSSITFSNVSFSYPGKNRNALHDISFEISAGENVALVGPSGSGKTTIARLLARFWDVNSGSISIGGVDLREMTQEELMKHVSFVFQDNRLFHLTLRENVLLGNPDATEAQLQFALRAAQCEEILTRLPNGLDTVYGSKGTELSGGELQRFCLARAILKDAPIVVLDEATAFADPENEYLIRASFDTLMKGKTVLFIAHRLSTIVNSDRIIALDEGKIIEEGTHEELSKRGGLYQRMWETYLKAADWRIA